MPETVDQAKGWFKTLESKIGLGGIVAGGLAIFFFWGIVSNFVVNALTNALEAGVMAGIILTVILFHTQLWYIYKSIIRFFLAMFIDMDPIGIRKTYKEKMEGKLEKFDSAVKDLNAASRTLQRTIDQNNSDVAHQMNLMQAADRNPTPANQAQKGVAARQAQRLQDQLIRWNKSLGMVKVLLSTLSQYRMLCAAQIEDITNDIAAQEVDMQVAKATKKGVAGAFSILNRSGADADMDYEATQAVKRKYDAAMGDMDQLLDVTKDILNNYNLEGDAAISKASEMLSKWQQQNSGMDLGTKDSSVSKSTIIEQAVKETEGKAQQVKQQAGGGDDYLSFVK